MKKSISILLAIIMVASIFSGVAIPSVYAAPGDNPEIYCYGGFGSPGALEYRRNDTGEWVDISCPYWRTRETGSISYCLESDMESPLGENYKRIDSLAVYSARTSNGIRAIILHGYPSDNGGLSADEAHYATQLAIWSWMYESAGVGHSLYEPSRIRAGAGYDGVYNMYHRLLNYSRNNDQGVGVHGISVSPSTVVLNNVSGQLQGTATVSFNNLNGHYSIDTSKLPSGVTITPTTGYNGQILTIRSTSAFNGQTINMQEVIVGHDSRRPANVFWYEPANTDFQNMVTFDLYYLPVISTNLSFRVNTGDMKIVKTSEDGIISNIPFTIIGNGVNQTVRTLTNGEIVIPNLQAGTYTVTEGTIDRYEPQTSRQVTVVSGGVATVTFNNKLRRGSLEVIKSSEDNYNQGHTFRLSGTSLSGHAVNEYAITNSQGVATFRDVLISGATPYVLEEVDTAIRYVIPANQTAAVKWNEVTRANFTNTLKKFRVTVNKKDSEFSYPQGDGKLNGAVYGLYNGSELVARYTTDQNGSFTTDYYICGDNWSIREITESEGYLVDSTVHHVGAEARNYTVEYNNALGLTSYETVKKGRVQIVKHTDDGSTKLETPETGATFELYLERAGSYAAARPTERDILIIDNDGLAISKKLPYGIYRCRQLSGWPGKEKMRDFLVYVYDSERTYTYIINNAAITSKLKVEKRNAEDGELIAAAGIGFQIKKPDGSLLVQHIEYPTPVDISVFYTNTEGWLMLPQELEWGYGYSLIEVQTAPYFFLNDEPVPFDVTGETTIITVTKYNAPQKARIHITKNGEVFSSVSLADGFYRPEYKVQSIAGGVYNIFADEDIYLNNKLMVRKNTLVSTLTTTVNGATSPLLYLGCYRIEEQQAPYSLITSGQVGPKFIELSYRGQTVETYTEDMTFFNDRQRVKISFEKVMEQDGLYKIGMNGEIAAVRMGLYADADIIAADGTKIPKDGLIEIVSVETATGSGTFTVDLPVESRVYLREFATDDQYILSDQKYPLVFEYAGQDVSLVELTANNGDPIENKIKRGNVEGLKVDENGEGLAGALIGLFAPDITEYTKENALLTDISGENGAFEFEGVPYGEWVCREIATPGAAYVLNDTVYPVTIAEDGEIIDIEIENRYVRGSVRTTKVDAEYPDNKLNGAIFDVYIDMDGNGEFDPSIDELAGMLDEIEAGIYQLDGLLYSGYFLKEHTAPEFFLLDENSYYFEILTNGEIVDVENQAGVGFINQPAYGELWLTKKDVSDGKLIPGCGIRIKDENGNIVVEGRTDENGEVKFRLRVGKYTYSEFDCPGYILDEAEYPFEITEGGQIIKAEMTNEKIPKPEIPDNPKTGDNSNIILWLALMGTSMAGFALTLRRRKRTTGAQ